MLEKSTGNLRVLLASGGTGGHIFPGLNIANALRELGVGDIFFLGVGRPAENTILSKTDFKRFTIETSGVKGTGIFGLLKFLLSAPKAFIAVWKLFNQIKPSVVISTGGYTAFFPILVAFIKRIPRVAHEAEKKFGVANTILSLFADVTTLAHADASYPFWAKVKFTGHPLRSSLAKIRRTQALQSKPTKLLIVGGSQGARALDLAGIELSQFFKSNELEIVHQARAENIAEIKAAYQNAGIKHEVLEFIHDMDKVLSWADIIVSRAGAGMVSEISAVNRPAILVPYPFAQGNHQVENARKLEHAGKALIVEEGQDFSIRLSSELKNLVSLENYNRIVMLPYTDSNLDSATKISKIALDLS